MIWLPRTRVVCVVALKRMSAQAARRKPLLTRALFPGCRRSVSKTYCHICSPFHIQVCCNLREIGATGMYFTLSCLFMQAFSYLFKFQFAKILQHAYNPEIY